MWVIEEGDGDRHRPPHAPPARPRRLLANTVPKASGATFRGSSALRACSSQRCGKRRSTPQEEVATPASRSRIVTAAAVACCAHEDPVAGWRARPDAARQQLTSLVVVIVSPWATSLLSRSLTLSLSTAGVICFVAFFVSAAAERYDPAFHRRLLPFRGLIAYSSTRLDDRPLFRRLVLCAAIK